MVIGSERSRVNKCSAVVGPLNAIPNTELWERLKREGRLQAEFEGDTFGFCNFQTVLAPVTLARGYRRVLSTLYSPESFFERMYALVDSLDCTHNQSVKRLNWRTFLRWTRNCTPAFMHLLFLDAHRAEYLRFMLWVLRRHPQKFLFALSRTLAGYHFIRYTADVMVPRLTLLEADLEHNIKPARLAG